MESEKTAIIASLFFPGVHFIATGGLNNLQSDKLKSLAWHRIILFPDLGAFRPDFIVPGMPEESDADDYVPLKGKVFLSFEELLLEACAATEGYYFVGADL